MAAMNRPYQGRVAALGTMHGKERAIAPPLWRRLGLSVTVPALDTDRLGTFSGEVERPLPPRETVLAKARLAMHATGLPLGLASEASFGPHPAFPWMAVGEEYLAFVDTDRGMELVERRLCLRTNFAHASLHGGPDLDGFLARVGFPRHAVMVRPNQGNGPLLKGLLSPGAVRDAVAGAAAISADGLARVETDMRAHLNPTRMGEIRRIAARLTDRLANPCPACASPGFGPAGPVPGLPCGWCGTPTDQPQGKRWACPACGWEEVRPGRRQPAAADPGRCPACNP